MEKYLIITSDMAGNFSGLLSRKDKTPFSTDNLSEAYKVFYEEAYLLSQNYPPADDDSRDCFKFSCQFSEWDDDEVKEFVEITPFYEVKP